MTPNRLAREAELLVGTPFRLHGRDPATGLDCIGLFAAAMARAERPVAVPTGYTLRLGRLDPWLPDPASCGLRAARGRFAPGDVVLLQPGPGQIHLAIADRKLGWVHAHAGLRKVVRDIALPDGPIIHHWRLLRAG
jgi:cell wall-associated NlpC family hydrolase